MSRLGEELQGMLNKRCWIDTTDGRQRIGWVRQVIDNDEPGGMPTLSLKDDDGALFMVNMAHVSALGICDRQYGRG